MDKFNDKKAKDELVSEILGEGAELSTEEVDITKLRETYKTYLDKKENEEIKIDDKEVDHLYTQFSNFTTIQLLYMMSRQMFDKDKDADKFLDEFVDSFMSQLRINFFRGIELYELKQETGIMSKIFGKSILDRGNAYSKRKVAVLFEKFEKQIKNSLAMNDMPPSDEDDFDEGEDPDGELF